MTAEQKEKISAVIENHQLAVIATVNGLSNPEAALVGFAFVPDSMQIVFGTFVNFRKYDNITRNNRVAIVIGWDNAQTVQYEGSAFELDGEELKQTEEYYLQKFPNSKKYIHSPEERFFKIIPEWIRYRDLNSKPAEVFEIKF